MRELTKFLSLFNDQSASARLLIKDYQPNHIAQIVRTAEAENALMRKIH